MPYEQRPLLRDAELFLGGHLRAITDGLPEYLRAPVQYHFGWLDSSLRPTQARSSKYLRPAMMLALCDALSLDRSLARDPAAALQLMHAFAFVHDDLIDGDTLRFDRPTVWSRFGVGGAVNSGDACIVLSLKVMLESQGVDALAGVRLIQDTMYGILDGQSIDNAFEGSVDKTLELWEREAVGKSGVSYSAGVAMIPTITGQDPELVDRLLKYGHLLGLALQAADDVLGLWGLPDRNSGRPQASDLRAGKITLPMILAMHDGSQEIKAALSQPVNDEGVDSCLSMIETSGGLEHAVSYTKNKLAELHALIDELPLPQSGRRDLAELVRITLPHDVSVWPNGLCSG